jgi:hypothetical protein
MQRHECIKHLFIYLNNFLEFYFFRKKLGVTEDLAAKQGTARQWPSQEPS